jgi:hypothetical protein
VFASPSSPSSSSSVEPEVPCGVTHRSLSVTHHFSFVAIFHGYPSFVAPSPPSFATSSLYRFSYPVRRPVVSLSLSRALFQSCRHFINHNSLRVPDVFCPSDIRPFARQPLQSPLILLHSPIVRLITLLFLSSSPSLPIHQSFRLQTTDSSSIFCKSFSSSRHARLGRHLGSEHVTRHHRVVCLIATTNDATSSFSNG